MSLLFRRSAPALSGEVWPPPPAGSRVTNRSDSLRVSAMWAALRLRSDLISTLPTDVYRRVDGRNIEVSKPPVMASPAAGMLWHEWVAATQWELDRTGNAFGEIVAWDAGMRPAQIELSASDEWSVRQTDAGVLEYRRQGQVVPAASVWHERQFVVPGVPVGLSPVAYAAWTLTHNLSAQEFAVNWFSSGAGTSGTLRNKQRTVAQDVATVMKERFRTATQNRDIFVTGSDWEFEPAAAAQSDARFLDAIKATAVDVARFFGVPADLIDAEVASKSITYANIAERNLQLLIMHLGPAITRRERVFSQRLVSRPRFVKFNTDALLRLDTQGKIAAIGAQIDHRILTPDEGRALMDLPPLTPAQAAEFDRLFGAPRPPSTTGAQ